MARKLGKGTYLENRLLISLAWRDLNSAGKFMFGVFRLKCQMRKVKYSRHHAIVIENNGEIVFTYDEGEKCYGLTRQRFKRGLDDLLAKGFIDVAEIGGGVHKVATKYTVSDRWMIYGQPHFQQAQRPEPVRVNPGFKKGNDMWKRRKKFFPSDANVHGAVIGIVHGEADSNIITVIDYVHGLTFKNVRKWRNGQWLAA